MKIILNKDVSTLGEEGDVCVVKDGYARNFLIPKELAVPYNKGSVNAFASKKDAIEKRKALKKEEARGLKEKLEGVSLTIKMPAGDTGKLFGSVTNQTVAEELSKAGFNVERKKIEVPDNNIKAIGNYTVHVKLYGNEDATIKLVIEKAEKIEV
jgi:large subunit ribosomal protein L9